MVGKNVVLLCTESTVDVDGDSYHIEVEAEVPDLMNDFLYAILTKLFLTKAVAVTEMKRQGLFLNA